MNCQKVRKRLSPFMDSMAENAKAAQIAAHLESCPGCREELKYYAELRVRLRSMGPPAVPDYFRDLVRIGVNNARQNTWKTWLRSVCEYKWSRIRTTPRIWYFTRILGTVTSFVFFFAIYVSMSPVLLDLPSQPFESGSLNQLRQQLGSHVLKNLGLTSRDAQRIPISSSSPGINDLYLLSFGESVSRTKPDDSFSVVALVDRSGAAKIQNILEYPADADLLSRFDAMIRSARYRPASQNGRAVEAHLVMAFSKISVYD